MTYTFKAPDSEAKSKSKKASTLGVVAICRNEQRDLGEFLEHLLPWVDEIVLVDDGSTDDTLKIARDAGPKVSVVSSPRLPGEHFSHQRNKGIRVARSDWLLHMDIDERVTPELRREIQEGIQRTDVDGLRFHRQNFFLHRPIRGGGWQLWSYLHVARREKFSFGGKIHEECHLSGTPKRVKTCRASCGISMRISMRSEDEKASSIRPLTPRLYSCSTVASNDHAFSGLH